MYNQFVSQSAMHVFTSAYNPANQVLHSLLCQAILQFSRVTEFWLRVPSLLGMLVYFWAAQRLCRKVCQAEWPATIASLVLVINPFTIGWLPVSSGVWMAAGLFLLALSILLPTLSALDLAEDQLWRGSLLLGICSGFQLSFAFVSLAAIFIILHFEFWGLRRLRFWSTVNWLILPFGVVVFALWSLTAVVSAPALPLDLLSIVVLPGVIALSIPLMGASRFVWKTMAVLGAFVIATVIWGGGLPNRFQQGPEAGVPKLARTLRNRLRRQPLREVSLRTSDELRESVEFYRRRYSLGAVRLSDGKLPASPAEYQIVQQTDLARPYRVLDRSRGLVLETRDP